MKTRFIEDQVRRSLAAFPVVLINGARQVGKSTLIESLYQKKVIDASITLDNLSTLTACKEDPQGFLTQFPTSVAIDEVQRCPELLIAIKHSVDKDRRPGRFLLTGSANILSYPSVAESLAGRMDLITLEGFSLSELYNQPKASSFIKDLFDYENAQTLMEKWEQDLKKRPPFSKTEALNQVFFGSFPEVALKRDSYFRNRWFNTYLTTYTERDVRDLSRTLDVIGFAKVCKLVALQTGQLLNIHNLSIEAGLDQRTVKRYLEILEMTFQITLLKPYFANIRKRLVRIQKIYVNDPGYAAFFAGIENEDNLMNHPLLGHLFETWLLAEIRKLLTLEISFDLCYFRTHQGKEIDFVLTKGSRTIGIECKATESLQGHHLSGLKDLQEVTPNFLGIILYFGDRCLRLSNNLIAAPFSLLI